MTGPRVILHVDMDAYFASVEQRDDPSLRGKPVLVGGRSARGVVAAASYEARRFGCRSAMPMAQALRLCPQAIVVRGQHGRYSQVSEQVFEILHRFTPAVEGLSLDEAFLDVTGSQRLHGDGVSIARQIRAAVQAELRLTCSVGVAASKFVAKLASDLHKPDGLTVAPTDPAALVAFLDPLPVERLGGVGPRTLAQLTSAGVRTLGDLRALSPERAAAVLGPSAERFQQLCRGEDDRPVDPTHERKSVGHEQTFSQDLPRAADGRAVLLSHVEQVSRRLREKGLRAQRVTVKLRTGDFHTVTRSSTLPEPTDVTAELWLAVAQLYDVWASQTFRPLRLVGVSASELTAGAGQLALFEPPERERQRRLDDVLDAIHQRFGQGQVRRAGGAPAQRQRDEPD